MNTTIYVQTFEHIHNARGGLFEMAFMQIHLDLMPKIGAADAAVEEILTDPFVLDQTDRINAAELREELREYGAWDEEELNDHAANLRRMIWLTVISLKDDEPWTTEVELTPAGLLGDW